MEDIFLEFLKEIKENIKEIKEELDVLKEKIIKLENKKHDCFFSDTEKNVILKMIDKFNQKTELIKETQKETLKKILFIIFNFLSIVFTAGILTILLKKF